MQLLEQHQALSAQDPRELEEAVQRLHVQDAGVEYLVILDAAGKPLASAGVGSLADMSRLLAAHHDSQGQDGDVLRLSHKLSSEEPSSSPGEILLGLSGSSVQGPPPYLTLGILLGIGAISLLIFLGMFFRFFRRFEELRHLTVTLSPVQPAPTDDLDHLMGRVSEMAQKFNTLINRLHLAAHAMAQTSAGLLAASTRQKESTTQQATSIAETGATVAELRETFHQASERAQTVIELARRSVESTSLGKASVDESVAAMKVISDQVLTISETIFGLVEQTAQIATLIDTVNDMAEQSNVLALNAAIEAAKAGDHGRGFAVVAREVRSLAERSKGSTARVQEILEEIDRANQEALVVIRDGTRKAEAGMELANRAGTAILELDRAIKDSSTAAKQIAASTRQQAVGVEQIWQAMRDIDVAVQESTRGILDLEQAARSIKELSDQMALMVAQQKGSAPMP